MHTALSASYFGSDLAGRYRLKSLIGEGASSWVFAATDARLEREVAVKLLKPGAEPEHSARRLRFVREGRTLARLAHPHVVAVYDAGETPDGHGYLVMELSHAGTLEAELNRRFARDIEETLALILPLLGALACAHDHGIIHRDLKPANIALVRHPSGKTRAKLLDFGIARPNGEGMSSGGLAGTPAYMAPEQARGEPLGPGADLWGIGVVLFRCLSGRLPFEASSSAAMLLKIVQERAVGIASLCPALPPRVAIALDRTLEPDPAHRYPDMRTFARVLGIACRQDGVLIDAEPEPIGLPEFGVWLQSADLESTQRKGPKPRVIPVHPAEKSLLARKQLHPWLAHRRSWTPEGRELVSGLRSGRSPHWSCWRSPCGARSDNRYQRAASRHPSRPMPHPPDRCFSTIALPSRWSSSPFRPRSHYRLPSLR